MSQTRRLGAILAADGAGYSRLMGADEEGTHERLTAHFRELVDPKIKEHRGRTVKNTGDGLLAEFASVVDAVRCAAQVQRGMIDREPEMPLEAFVRPLLVRAHQPRVAGHIGGEDRGETAFGGLLHGLPPAGRS